MSTKYAIQTIQLTRRFQKRVVVDHVSLEVPYGEVFGFLGPNGAGKTTTIAMLLGLLKPDSGQAIVLGYDVQQYPAEALRGVGAMVDAPAFYPYLSGRDNLRVLAVAEGIPSTRIDEVLAQVDLTEQTRDQYKNYSQGMKQRLAIAAALLSSPPLIILDEPTNGLDPAGMVEIRDLIRTLARRGHTIFLSSHLLHEVEHLCHRVAILKQGKIRFQGRVEDLIQRGRRLQIRVLDDPTPAVALLTQVEGVRSVEQHEQLLLVEADPALAATLNAMLASHHIPVAEVRVHETSLEQVFLEITGKTHP